MQGVPLEGSDVVAIEVQDAGAEALEDETSKLKNSELGPPGKCYVCWLKNINSIVISNIKHSWSISKSTDKKMVWVPSKVSMNPTKTVIYIYIYIYIRIL